MEAQIQNQGGKEPAERSKANLAETQHQFEISDPLTDATYRFPTAEAVTAKANELGASQFQERSADGQVSQISKVDSVWMRSDGKSLADIQTQIDKDSVEAELANRVNKSETNRIEKGNKPFRAREKEAGETKPDSQNKRMAETFANQSATNAVKAYPELAGAVAAVAAMEKKVEADGLNPQQRAVVAARIHQNVVNSIERGDIPKVKIKEAIEIKREPKEEREYAR